MANPLNVKYKQLEKDAANLLYKHYNNLRGDTPGNPIDAIAISGLLIVESSARMAESSDSIAIAATLVMINNDLSKIIEKNSIEIARTIDPETADKLWDEDGNSKLKKKDDAKAKT